MGSFSSRSAGSRPRPVHAVTFLGKRRAESRQKAGRLEARASVRASRPGRHPGPLQASANQERSRQEHVAVARGAVVQKPDRARYLCLRRILEFLNFCKSQMSELHNGDSTVSFCAGRVQGVMPSLAQGAGNRGQPSLLPSQRAGHGVSLPSFPPALAPTSPSRPGPRAPLLPEAPDAASFLASRRRVGGS